MDPPPPPRHQNSFNFTQFSIANRCQSQWFQHALKCRADVIRSPKQGYKRIDVLKVFFFQNCKKVKFYIKTLAMPLWSQLITRIHSSKMYTTLRHWLPLDVSTGGSNITSCLVPCSFYGDVWSSEGVFHSRGPVSEEVLLGRRMPSPANRQTLLKTLPSSNFVISSWAIP